jgi:formylmethanofuran dehydrogenase subunit E
VVTMPIDPKLEKMLQTAAKFHGHVCPGLAIGVVASRIALTIAKRASDEELVAIVENDACGVDAIQALTGCTYGKGNLIHNDYGKSVYIFYNRNTGKAIRLAVRPEIFNQDMPREERIMFILEKGEELFNVREVSITPPEKARIFNDVRCDNCGEPIMATRIQERAGRKLCIPCFNELKNK